MLISVEWFWSYMLIKCSEAKFADARHTYSYGQNELYRGALLLKMPKVINGIDLEGQSFGYKVQMSWIFVL